MFDCPFCGEISGVPYPMSRQSSHPAESEVILGSYLDGNSGVFLRSVSVEGDGKRSRSHELPSGELTYPPDGWHI